MDGRLLQFRDILPGEVFSDSLQEFLGIIWEGIIVPCTELLKDVDAMLIIVSYPNIDLLDIVLDTIRIRKGDDGLRTDALVLITAEHINAQLWDWLLNMLHTYTTAKLVCVFQEYEAIICCLACYLSP